MKKFSRGPAPHGLLSSYKFLPQQQNLSIVRPPAARAFTSTRPFSLPKQARIYDPIRDPGTLQTHLLLSSSARTPLITLWTASWCPSCRSVAPVIREVVEEASASADEGDSSGSSEGDGTGAAMYAEVEIDSPTGGGEMGGRFAITSIPTLLAFSKGEPVSATRVTDVKKLGDRNFLRGWLAEEIKRDGGGKGFLAGLFGRGR